MPFPETPRVIYNKNPLNEEVRGCLSKAERLVKRLPAGDLKRNANGFLSSLRKILSMESQAGADVSMLPVLEAVCPDDHSIVFEWAYDDCRLGFSVESNSSESSWYLITIPESGGVRASGLIACSNFEQWLRWLVFLVRLRS